ncbi:MAG: serine/threonine-protein kinase [Deltaproteobacteria bacterium]
MDPLIGRVLLERYEVLQRIGSGGMGAVYVGKQTAVGRKVALKVLRSDLMANDHVRQRFRREAEIIARLSHPHTIQLIDYGETPEGLAVMVMELLLGASLSERLKQSGPLPMELTVRIGKEVAASLAEAHLHGLVHRDLKPANIFLADVGSATHAKVLDFGIARILDEEATRLTSTGQVFGTPRYMSPEQAMSTADVDARSDLYSLGLILYECIVGQPPFVAQTSIQYLSAHTTQAPPKLRDQAPSAPVALEALIDACLAKEPDDRPQTAEVVEKALERIQRSLESGEEPFVPHFPGRDDDPTRQTVGPGTSPPGPTDRSPPADAGGSGGSNRTPLIAMGVLFLIAAVAVGAWAAMRDTNDIAPIRDASVVAMANQRDAGRAEVVEPPRDAGTRDAGVRDAGVEPPRDAGKKRRIRPHKNKNKNKNRPPPPPPPPPPGGTGFTTGPRTMTIDFPVEDDTPSLEDIAKKCGSSVFGGLAKLDTQGCAAGCKIVIDDQCAGATPAEGRAIPKGRRKVTVVCDGKAKKTRRLRFKDGQTTTYKCP